MHSLDEFELIDPFATCLNYWIRVTMKIDHARKNNTTAIKFDDKRCLFLMSGVFWLSAIVRQWLYEICCSWHVPYSLTDGRQINMNCILCP